MNPLLQPLTLPDLWQQDAVKALRAGQDVVVHAPTGAGKTHVFELFHPELKGQAVFTVPTRALANDKLAEWRGRRWDVGISTGDIALRLDAKVVVAALETQRGRFLRREGPHLLVVDEYQLISDPHRGVNYELALALAPPETQLLLLSGSVANPQGIVAWLRRIGRNAVPVSHDIRPVPLTEVDLEALPNRAAANIRGYWPRLITNALRADLGPVLMFAPRCDSPIEGWRHPRITDRRAAMNERPLTHYARISVAAAVVTFTLKLVAWRVTGSVGLLSDALESLVNLAAAFVALGSLAVAAMPEDEDHAFGHSKAEYFAAGIEGALILVAAAAIGWSAVDRFFSPQPLRQPFAGVAISIVASLVNLGVARTLLAVGRRRKSIALEADAKHLMADVWTSAAVVVGVVLVALTGWLWLDPLIGVLLAIHIVTTGVPLVRESMLGLMDTGLPAPELAIIRDTLANYRAEGVQYHALRTRRAAARQFMSVHLLMPGTWTIARGHDLAERLEADLRKAVPGLNVLTHLEPDDDPASWKDVDLERNDLPG